MFSLPATRTEGRAMPMNRREWIKESVVAGAAVVGSVWGGTISRGAAAEPQAAGGKIRDPKMKVSVLSYSFRGLLSEGKIDLFGYLETCKYRSPGGSRHLERLSAEHRGRLLEEGQGRTGQAGARAPPTSLWTTPTSGMTRPMSPEELSKRNGPSPGRRRNLRCPLRADRPP